jgi:hypothetical protein
MTTYVLFLDILRLVTCMLDIYQAHNDMIGRSYLPMSFPRRIDAQCSNHHVCSGMMLNILFGTHLTRADYKLDGSCCPEDSQCCDSGCCGTRGNEACAQAGSICCENELCPPGSIGCCVGSQVCVPPDSTCCGKELCPPGSPGCCGDSQVCAAPGTICCGTVMCAPDTKCCNDDTECC